MSPKRLFAKQPYPLNSTPVGVAVVVVPRGNPSPTLYNHSKKPGMNSLLAEVPLFLILIMSITAIMSILIMSINEHQSHAVMMKTFLFLCFTNRVGSYDQTKASTESLLCHIFNRVRINKFRQKTYFYHKITTDPIQSFIGIDLQVTNIVIFL